MTQEQYKKAFESIAAEAKADTMSISEALARVALLSLEYQRTNGREANLTREALEWRLSHG